MKTSRLLLILFCGLLTQASGLAQSLINIDFGGHSVSGARGAAGTGQSTNDFWNAYTHYSPRFSPGMAEIPNGQMAELKFADGSPGKVSVAVMNAPGVWGNATGDPMLDSFVFAPNGSNIVVTLNGLEPGRYHLFAYGHADADGGPEQNSVFSLRVGASGLRLGPLASSSLAGWRAGQPWQEGRHYVVFRDVTVHAGDPVVLEVAAGAGGIAVLNGLQIFSRGTAPPKLSPAEVGSSGAVITNLLFREIHYEGSVSTSEARFKASIDVESLTTNELSAVLFEGDVALLNPKLPPGWRIVPEGKRFMLISGAPGAHRIELDINAKVSRNDPWNEVGFAGPPAAIATVVVRSPSAGTEVHLAAGTELDEGPRDSAATNAVVRGALGPEGRVGIRWQSQAAEVNRESVVAAETSAAFQLNPSVIRVSTSIRFDVVQGRLARARVALPPDQALTKVTGETIREWRVEKTAAGNELTVEFLRPIEKSTTLTLLTEQAIPQLPASATISAPQPLGLQREQGKLTLVAEDVLAKVDSLTGLRQIDSTPETAAAYNFAARPATAKVALARVEPLVKVADRVRVQLEETRFRIGHEMDLTIERAGLYSLEAPVPAGFTVADVAGGGVEDWRVATNRLKIDFSRRAIGNFKLYINLERSLVAIPPELVIEPLHLAGVEKETAFIGATAVPGLMLKTSLMTRAREIPIGSLPQASSELLAYRAETGDWRLTLSAERPPSRLVAEVFDLMTVGDGLVGGSATLRYAIVNQGVQAFRVRLPEHWRNVEFVGANIRRTDHLSNVWTVALQDKAWDAYTLVVTYDFPFDAKQATLDAGGAHPLDVERETGTFAVTAAPGLEVKPAAFVEPLRSIDPSELASADSALISRQVVFAAKYEGTNYDLKLGVTRHDQVALLDAVADRAQLKSVVTDQGEMLTQASFMVKNNDRQYQRFLLPPGATLWGVAVDNEPVKADRDGDWVLVSLPRNVDRDRAFAVDLSYAQQAEAFKRTPGLWPKGVNLVAPSTDVPGTYAEWDIYAPLSQHLGSFGGNMIAARGTSYGLHEAWAAFTKFYSEVFYEHSAEILFGAFSLASIFSLIFMVRRWGFRGFVGLVMAGAAALLLAGMGLPALSKAKSRAQRITSVSNLKVIGLAIRTYEADHQGASPRTLDDLVPGEITERTLHHPSTGERYTYVGAGVAEDQPSAVLAYGPIYNGGVDVLFADGSVQPMSTDRFNEVLAKKPEPPAQAPVTAGYDAAASDSATVKENNEPRDRSPTLARQYSIHRSLAQVDTREGLKAEMKSSTLSLGDDFKKQALGRGEAGKDVAFGLQGAGGAAPSASAMVSGLAAAPAGPPAVAGLKSLKIEIPKSGQHLIFTRTLNLSGQPAAIKLQVMSSKSFIFLRSGLQAVCFIAGIIMVLVQWRRGEPSALWFAAGAALTVASIGSLFLAWQRLHFLLIGSIPLALLIGISWLVWRTIQTFPRRQTKEVTLPPDLPAASAAASGVALLLFGLWPSSSCQAGIATVLQPISITSAEFSGEAGEHSAGLEATLNLVSSATNQTVVLFGKEVGLQEFSATQGDVRLWREGDRVGVLMPAPGSATIKLKLIAKVGGDIGKRTLDFALPAALGNHFSLLLHEPDAEVDCAGAVSFSRQTSGTDTKIDAVLPPLSHLGLSWSPRLKRAADGAVALFSTQSSLIVAGGGMVSTRTRFEFSTPQGELRTLRVEIPVGHRLLRVTGDAVRRWDTAATNRSELSIELGKASNAASVEVETEVPLDPLPAKVSIAVPRPLDVRRATGLVAIKSIDEAGLTVERFGGLERIELSEFEKAFGKEASGLAGAWRFQRPEFDLGLAVETLVPRLEATVRNHFVIGTEELGLQSYIAFRITRAGTFSLRLAVPVGFQIDSVKCGAMRSWDEHLDPDGHREIEIALKQKTSDVVEAAVYASQSLSNLPPQIQLAGIHPVGAAKITGYVSASAEPGLALKTASLAGLTEIPVTELPPVTARLTPALAYKYLAFQPVAAAPWDLRLGVEALESWVRAEVGASYSVTESLVTGWATVKYDIQNAPRKEFSLRVPANWRNVELMGAGIRRRDSTTNGAVVTWRLELQTKVQGEFQLTAKWEQPRIGTNQLNIAGLETVGTERETGWLAFDSAPQLQLAPVGTNDALLRIDAAELPAWAPGKGGGSAAASALSFRYLRPGWTLPISVERFQDAAVLQALADQTQLRTVVAEDGQWMTRLTLRIRNNGRQHLSVGLPGGAKVWSAFVDGQPVRPAQRDGRLLLPLEASHDRDTPVSVEITYVGEDRFPKGSGGFNLESPKLDIPLKEAHWEVFLPPDYSYDRFSGSMNYEGAEWVPVSQDFTLAAYNRQEAEQHAAASSAVSEGLDKVRRGIASGLFGEVSRLDSYRNGSNSRENAREAESLAESVNRAQASNLIRAQERYAGLNSALGLRYGIMTNSWDATKSYSPEVAVKQAVQVERAQALAVARVTPLHVNLPTYGIRHSFVQVLQTETDRPLTVTLRAANERGTGWFGVVVRSLGGFAALWMASAWALAVRGAKA